MFIYVLCKKWSSWNNRNVYIWEILWGVTVTIYTNRYRYVSTTSPAEESTSPASTVTEYNELRSIGASLTQQAKYVSRQRESVQEAKRNRRELARDLTQQLSEERRSLKRKGTLDTPAGQARLQAMTISNAQKLADQDAIIAKREASYNQRAQAYSSSASQYTPETVSKAFAAAPKQYHTGGTGVASFSDSRKEAQLQASDKALLSSVQERPGIIKPGQLKSQYYKSQYGGGTYTGFTEGTYNGNNGPVTITARSVPVTSAKTGKTEYRLLPKEAPKTYTAIDLFSNKNRDALRGMSASGEYQTAGALFAGPQYTPNNELDIKPGKRDTFSVWAAKESYKASLGFNAATTPYDQARYAAKNLYYFGLSAAAESTTQGKEFAGAVLTGALWRTSETVATRLSELGGKGKGTRLLRITGKSGKLFLGKVAPVVGTAAYAYDISKQSSYIKDAPEGVERTRAASGLFAKVGLETFGFYGGYKGTAKVLPLSAYSTTKPTSIDYVSVQRGTQTVRGTATNPVMLRPAKTTFYSSPTRFEGVRKWFSSPVRMVSTLSSKGGFVQKQYSKGFISVTRQSAGSTSSRTTVYRPGKAPKLYRRGDVASSFREGTDVPAYYTRTSRIEKGYAGDTVLLQRANRVTLYGKATPLGRGTYLVSTGRQYGSTVAVSRAPITRFDRVVSQVGKRMLPSKSRGTVTRQLSGKKYSFSFYQPRQEIAVYGARRQTYGIAQNTLVTAPESVAQQSAFAFDRLSLQDTPLPTGRENVAYPVKTLLATKGTVTTKIAYRIITTGRIETVKIGRAPTVQSAAVEQKRISSLGNKPYERKTTFSPNESPQIALTKGKNAITITRLGSKAIPKTALSSPTSVLMGAKTRTRIIPIASFKARQSPATAQKPMITPSVKIIPKSRQIAKPAVIQQSRLTPSQVSVSKLSTVQVTTQRLSVTRTPGRGVWVPRVPMARIPPPTAGFFPSFGGSRGRKTLYGSGSQQKKYTPSLFAIGVGIKGKAPKKGSLGFSIRPITS